MRFVFNERKAAEAAAHLLTMAGGAMPYIQLIKLLYLADRESLVETGFPITGDRMVSMARGPVLSAVYDRICDGPPGNEPSPWFEFIAPPRDWQVSLLKPPPGDGELSDFEVDVLQKVYEQFGSIDRWTLIELLHQLPEWHDPHGSSLPIDPAEILRHVGKTDEEIARLTAEAEHMWYVEHRTA